MDTPALQKIVVATGNPKKLREIREIMDEVDSKAVFMPQSEWNVPDAVEDGLSFVENAILKARHAARLTGLPAIADDSGLEVDALMGQPGIYSARYAGEPVSDEENMAKLIKALSALDHAKTGAHGFPARFRCVMAYLRHADDPSPLIAEGSWEGQIIDAPAGKNGFGYDPVFYVPETSCTAAQLTAQQKHALSHRGQALRALAATWASS